MENASVGSFPETRVSAQAAAEYVNLTGGVHGRPVELRTCATDGSPESSQNCAIQLISDEVVAVVGGVDIGAAAALPLYERSGISYISGSPQLYAELTADNSFALTGGTLAELLGIADHLVSERHVRSVHALYVDLPGLLSDAVRGAENILRQLGVADVLFVAEKPEVADFAPALSQVAAGNPDAIIVNFPPQSCLRVMQAASALQIQSPIYYPATCIAPAVARAGRGGLDKAFFASSYLPVSESSEDTAMQVFRSVIPEDSQSPSSQASFSAILVLRSLLEPLDVVAPAAIQEALRATRNGPNPMAHPITCDGEQIAIFPSICNTAVNLLQWRDGEFRPAHEGWIDGRRLTELVG